MQGKSEESLRALVLTAKDAGATYKDAAALAGISPNKARTWWLAYLDQEQPERDLLRKQHAAVLQELIAKLEDAGLSGVRDLLAVMERQSKLLGLDHSEKREDARLALESTKIAMLATALNLALAGLPDFETRRNLFLDHLEALEEAENGPEAV